MTLSPGSHLGPYEVVALLGAGGMGEVYRARDTKLNRDVALKVLPELFALDPDRLARFKREAQVLASLNHPNIAAIYGLEESGDVRAIVMELVEGPTLAEVIARSPLPLDQALPIARQIADALEAAHEQGVMHRDLKPANIKVRTDGLVKVLDFGLAKALDPVARGFSPADATNSPTITSPAMTGAGVILGTAAYMSPEQARGKPTDKRTDIWAFGCVLYEMLTGKRAFGGDEIHDTLAFIITKEPDWSALPPQTPLAIRQLLRRALVKDPRERLHDIADARIELKEALTTPEVEVTRAVEVQVPRRSRERVAWIVAALLAVAAAAALAVPYFRAPALAPETRLEITTPATTDPISFAISPDGRRLVFVASGDGQSRLWVRPLDATTAQPLAGSDGAATPFWSPDSRSVAFSAGGKLKRIDIGGGLPQTLANASGGRGGAWSSDGVILFAPLGASPLFRVPASGGEAVAVTKLDVPRQTSHRFPQFLPGGRQFLYFVVGTPEAQGIYLGSLDAPETKRLTAAETAGVYAPPAWLLFVRQGTLVARRFDPAQGELAGDPVTVADPVGFDGGLNVGAFSVSAAGPVAYRAGGGAGRRQLTWFDRSGKALGTVGAPDENGLLSPRLSPDGRRVAVYRTVQGNTDIWVLDAIRTTRFTFDASLDRYQIWSSDGSRIVFDSNRKGPRDLYQKPSNGAGSEELFLESPLSKAAQDWSADGRFLLYLVVNDPKTPFDLWVLPLTGDRKPFVFLNTSFEERAGQFSPDGRWVAYTSNESGRFEIYVRPFPGPGGAPSAAAAPTTPGGQWQISTGGGYEPRWSPDGKELYYIAPDSKLMAAPIAVNGATLEAGAPVALFQTRIVGGGTNVDLGRQYDVARDGRFLINVTTDEATASPITVILNWAGLKK